VIILKTKFLEMFLKGYFFAAVFLFFTILGVIVGQKNPALYESLRVVWVTVKHQLVKQPPHFVLPAKYPGEGVIFLAKEKVFDGATLVSSFWPNDQGVWMLGIRLIDLNGVVLHSWSVDPKSIWPESPHHDYATREYNDKVDTLIHGMQLFPNGDIVFNLEFFSLVKMNAKGEVIWKIPRRTHHSIFVDEEGNYWVSGMKWHDQANEVPYPGIKAPVAEDTILKVSPDGVIEREISVLKVIFDSGYLGLLHDKTGDLLHLNDIEVLGSEMAKKFPDFSEGDIMVSLRNINSIIIIDGKTEKIKWYMSHPFIQQHDPDFESDGSIVVFDNQYAQGSTSSAESRILKVDAGRNSFEVMYEGSAAQPFYTARGGKQQLLSNGNLLITETFAGRVFEVTPQGETVWSWLAPRWGKEHVPEVLEGTRYSYNQLEFIKKE